MRLQPFDSKHVRQLDSYFQDRAEQQRITRGGTSVYLTATGLTDDEFQAASGE